MNLNNFVKPNNLVKSFIPLLGNESGNRGKEFVLAFMTNWDAYKGVPSQVSITTHCAGVVTVNITVPLLSQVTE